MHSWDATIKQNVQNLSKSPKQNGSMINEAEQMLRAKTKYHSVEDMKAMHLLKCQATTVRYSVFLQLKDFLFFPSRFRLVFRTFVLNCILTPFCFWSMHFDHLSGSNDIWMKFCGVHDFKIVSAFVHPKWERQIEPMFGTSFQFIFFAKI